MHIIYCHFISDLESLNQMTPYGHTSFSGQFTNDAGHERDLCFSEKNSPPTSTTTVRCCASWKPGSLHLSPIDYRRARRDVAMLRDATSCQKGRVGSLVGWLVGWLGLLVGLVRLVGVLVCWFCSLIEVNPKKFPEKVGVSGISRVTQKRKVEEYWELPSNIAIHSYVSLHFEMIQW